MTCGLGLCLECFNVVLVEGTQHTNGTQELRHQILIATADTGQCACMGERENEREGEREREEKREIHSNLIMLREY